MSDPANRVFVYGTLLPGGEWWHVVEPWVWSAEPATCSGGLWDTGRGYPAARFDESVDAGPDRSSVHGAVLELLRGHVDEALAELDSFEDEFARVVVETDLGAAWAYEWSGPTESFIRVHSGRFVPDARRFEDPA